MNENKNGGPESGEAAGRKEEEEGVVAAASFGDERGVEAGDRFSGSGALFFPSPPPPPPSPSASASSRKRGGSEGGERRARPSQEAGTRRRHPPARRRGTWPLLCWAKSGTSSGLNKHLAREALFGSVRASGGVTPE